MQPEGERAANAPQLIVIAARQRSGTTALAETLSAGSAVQSFGEVFHHNQQNAEADVRHLRLNPEAGFFNFKIEQLRGRPELAYPTVENLIYLFDCFIDHLSTLSSKRWLLLDIKYNSWHHFERFYSIPGHAPFLLHLLRKRNAAFIHVIRANAFCRYCSEQLALLRGKWHAERDTEPEDGSITIDPEDALRDMIETRRQVEFFTNFLSASPRRIELRYEEMFRGDRLSEATEFSLARLLDGDWVSGPLVPLRKVTPPLRSLIKNRDEVLAYFEPTTFWPVVSAALGD